MSFRKDYFDYAESIDYTNSDYTNGFDFTEESSDQINNLFVEV
ncbi:MAG: hypothetical protein ACI924_000939, partial [Flavobacterium sp.]